MTDSGLRTASGDAVPLKCVRVWATVIGGHTRVRLRHVYVNGEAASVEAVYVFPVPANATVCGFAMVNDQRKLEADVIEREAAFAKYHEAIDRGDGASLLEQERMNVFTASVGNLLPNQETVIEIDYVQALTADEGALRWMLPTLVAPRYIPGSPVGRRTGHGWAEPTDDVPDADRITPRIGDTGYGLQLTLTIDLGGELAIESPSHPITVQRQGSVHTVTLSRGEVALDRDIVVTARGPHGAIAGAIAHRDSDGPGYFALTVVPDLFDASAKATGTDVVFLVDTSSSMDGESLPQAKNALRLCLRHLRQGDRFNVIHFDSDFAALHKEPIPFSQKTLEEADRWINQLHASGGTELREPLMTAVKMATQGVVVLLTDGQVGNEAEIVSEVMSLRKSTRLYTFGIGTNVGDQLVRELAHRTQGGVELIHPGERIEDKVTATFAKAFAERVSDLRLTFDGVRVDEVAPMVAAPLIDGEPWTLFGRYIDAGDGHIELAGKRGDEPFTMKVAVHLPARAEQPSLRAFWAAERIRDLSQGTKVTDGQRKQIIELAIANKVSSPYTAFIVVETRSETDRALPRGQTRFIPVSAPAGWATLNKPIAPGAGGGGFGSTTGSFVGASMDSAPDMADAMIMAAPARAQAPVASSAPMPAPKKSSGGFLSRLRGLIAQAPAPSASSSADAFATLFLEQRASGLWSSREADDALTLSQTMGALLQLLRADVTTAHPTYGAQVRKAVEALVKLVAANPTLAAASKALAIAWLVSTGVRTRARITSAARRFPQLQAQLNDETALRQSMLTM